MADYIEREKVTELIDYHQEEYCEAESYFGLLKEDFLQLPSADVAPVVHGKWIEDADGCVVCSECSNCAEVNCISGEFMESPYCSGCGAKMEGGDMK